METSSGSEKPEVDASVVPAASPTNRSRNKTVYLDKYSTSELRAELLRDLKHYSGNQGGNEVPADGFVPVKPVARKFGIEVAKIPAKQPPPVWGPIPDSVPTFGPSLVEESDSELSASQVDNNLPERSQAALTTILKPEIVAVRNAPRNPKAVVPTAVAVPEPQPGQVEVQGASIVGFLISFDKSTSGEFITIRAGRSIVTSDPKIGGVQTLLIDDATVSASHAALKSEANGEVYLLDQFSEHGTAIRHLHDPIEEKLNGAAALLQHGDTVRFGQRTFHVCLVAK